MIILSISLIGIFFATILIILIWKRKLTIQGDFFVLFYFLQIFIYLHICPIISLISLKLEVINPRVLQNNSENIEVNYLLTTLLILFFFEIPYLIVYLKNKPKENLNTVRIFKIKKINFIVFALLFTFFSVKFLEVAISTELFFKRIGHEAYSNRLASLSFFESLTYKYYYKSGLFLLGIFLIGLIKTKPSLLRIFLSFLFLLNLLVFGFYELINNRLQSIITILFLFSIFTYFKNDTIKKSNFHLKKIILLSCVLILTVKIVENLRTGFVENGGEVKIENFNPFGKNDNEDGNDTYYWRLNGLDLISRILPEITNNPLPDFSYYFNSFRISYGSIWNDNYSTSKKENLETTIKSQLIRKYFPNSNSVDYYSCSVTDLFGTSNILGILLFAIFHSYFFSKFNNFLLTSRKNKKIIFSLFIIPFFLVFEYESTVCIFGWFKLVPVYLLLSSFSIIKINSLNENK